MALKVGKSVGVEFRVILMVLIFQHILMAIINGFSYVNGILMTNQCIFNGVCVQ